MTKNKFVIRNSQFAIDLAALALITALVLLFFWRILTPRFEDRAVFPPGDFTDQFWMFRQYAARAFAEGRLPLWSDNFNSGHPFLADVQSAVFYPISLIWTLAVVALRGANFTLLDLEIEAIFHFILAGAFMYLFAKGLLGARIPALVSALTFTFGGYLTSYPPQQLAILETATWLPLILLFLDLAVRANVIASPEGAKQSPTSELEIASQRPLAMTQGTRYYIAAGIALGIAALAGHPQTFLFVGYAGVIFFVWRVASGEWRGRITFYVLRFTFVLLIAAGIAAAQWIPSIEYQTVSTRAAIGWAEAASGFPTLDPLQMILPGFASAFQAPLYIGVLPLWLALFALFVNRSRRESAKIFWILLALGALIVSFGFYTFGYALFYLVVPGFALFRGQERLAFIISFSFALLAGYGFRDLMQASFDAKHARRAWALLPAGVVVSALMLFTMYIAAREHPSGRLFFLTDRAAFMMLVFILSSALVGALILPSPVRWFSERGKGWGWGLAIALLLFDLFSINNAAYNAETTPRFPVTPIIETIKNDRGVFRVVDEGTQPGHFGIAYRLEEIGGISPLRIAHYNTLLDNLPEENLWRLLNVRYVITKRPGFANADVIAQDGETRLLRLQNDLPRAWFVVAAQDKVADSDALAAMRNSSFDPHQLAYVADTLPFAPVPNAMMLARFEKREPEHLVLSIVTPTDQLLVLSEVYYPGWRALVDGKPAPILRANVALRAVPVPANAAQVELIFDPWSVKIGIAITAITLLAVLIKLFADR